MKKLTLWLLLFSTMAFGADGDRYIQNPNQDKDIIFQVNDGGVKTDVLKINGANGSVQELKVSSSCSAGNFCSGTYTPSLTMGTNMTAVSGCDPFSYIRVGVIVLVSGYCSNIQATSDNTVNTSFGVSLPFASNFALDGDAAGTFSRFNSVGSESYDSGHVRADTTNDRAEVLFNANEGGGRRGSVIFQYIIK